MSRFTKLGTFGVFDYDNVFLVGKVMQLLAGGVVAIGNRGHRMV